MEDNQTYTDFYIEHDALLEPLLPFNSNHEGNNKGHKETHIKSGEENLEQREFPICKVEKQNSIFPSEHLTKCFQETLKQTKEPAYVPPQNLHFDVEALLNSEVLLNSRLKTISPLNLKFNFDKLQKFESLQAEKLPMYQRVQLELFYLTYEYCLVHNLIYSEQQVAKLLEDFGFVQKSNIDEQIVELRALKSLPALKLTDFQFSFQFEDTCTFKSKLTPATKHQANIIEADEKKLFNINGLFTSEQFLEFLKSNLSANALAYLSLTPEQIRFVEENCDFDNPDCFDQGLDCINFHYYQQWKVLPTLSSIVEQQSIKNK